MIEINRVVLIGRLTKDPELKFTPGKGTAVATFTLAVDRRIKSPCQPEADFIPVVVWGKIAENTANYVGKGRLVGIGGRIQTRSYEDKQGIKRYVTEVVADEVQITAVAKIIEGAMENDMDKVKAYAEHIAKYLDEHDERGSKIIRSRLDGSYKNKPKVVLD